MEEEEIEEIEEIVEEIEEIEEEEQAKKEDEALDGYSSSSIIPRSVVTSVCLASDSPDNHYSQGFQVYSSGNI